MVYYKRLKDFVKDKFFRISKLDNLVEIVTKVYKIDNCFYFKNQEKKGRYRAYSRINTIKNQKSNN